MKDRYLRTTIEEFLDRKMVFVGGPRQVGKTTLCLSFLNPPSTQNSAYLSWDNLLSKEHIKRGELPKGDLVVLDEIHKYRHWRNLVKGFYDTYNNEKKFIVTGSARLDHYRRGGDSLLGRYRYVRLHPFSLPEIRAVNGADLDNLLKFGGFPEPFLAQSEKEWRHWCRERRYRLVNDDVRGLENLRDYNSIETLAEALPARVGAPLSIKSLAEDLDVNPRTVESWVQILERVYYCYRVAPFGAPKIRAVKKEKKLYLWDWSEVDEVGFRFENLVASHLLKYCHFIEDSEGHTMELRFVRDRDKREVDFVVLKNKKPLFAVECKSGERVVSPHIHYFKERTNIPYFYQVHRGGRDYMVDPRIRVLPFITFCKEINCP